MKISCQIKMFPYKKKQLFGYKIKYGKFQINILETEGLVRVYTDGQTDGHD